MVWRKNRLYPRSQYDLVVDEQVRLAGAKGGLLRTGYNRLARRAIMGRAFIHALSSCDLFVFLFFGLVAVSGTYYVQALMLTPAVVMAAFPAGTLTTAILVVNNLRDIDTDGRTGKRTLAVMIGPEATRLEYAWFLVAAYATPLLFWLLKWSSAWVLLPLLTLPLAARLVRAIYGTIEGAALNKALAGTANLDLVFSLLFALGLLL